MNKETVKEWKMKKSWKNQKREKMKGKEPQHPYKNIRESCQICFWLK